jgi:nucleoside-diphosphate-sugar epimerase
MKGHIFIAGATGVIGKPLCRLLVADGWTVTGATRSQSKADDLKALGVTPCVVDVFDLEALSQAVATAAPEIVIHQLTDLPDDNDPEQMRAARERNNRIRDEGTRNLISAAISAGAIRIIAQSIAFAYAAGPKPYTEKSPIDPAMSGVISLENQILKNGAFIGIVQRYGRLYGPGTWAATPPKDGPLHTDDAADAARRAVTRGGGGIYNIAEEDGFVSSKRAATELGWKPGFRLKA